LETREGEHPTTVLLLIGSAKETRKPGLEEEERELHSEPVRADYCKITRDDFYF
jgi:hypothetical protein